jgi:tetratricopeptide (TPR) repeat protein/uncharacterized protein YozE (UPF0346 family)
MSGLLLLVLAAGATGAQTIETPNGPLINPIVSKAREKENLIGKLKRDIFKVERSVAETQKLIAKSRNAPYLPDLEFRLAELYVEESRYRYYLQAEQRPEGQKGALVSPETKLLKQKAIQIYDRILREFPDFHDGDKVTFYLAHEQRELGSFDDMLKTLGELIRKFPNSPLRLDADQILGDYFFDKSDLGEAEKHYQAILEAPPSPTHDLARYKLGWVRINQNKHAEAVVFFEAAAASAPIVGVDQNKALNVKREALLDLVYSYTEARPAKGALNYFEKLSDSRSTYSLALEKLGNRYFIKQQYEYAIPALRKLMEVQPDPELDLERSEKIYDSLKAGKNKVPPRPEDIKFLVRAAVEAKTNPDMDEGTRKKQLAELEEMSRDLATQLHVTAQKKDEKNAYIEAALAYKEYLGLFRPQAQVRAIMQNRADALFAAHEFPEAARQFEELSIYLEVHAKQDAKAREEAAYGALLSHFSSLKQGEVERLNAFEVADARQALKLMGAAYVGNFPKSEHATDVKFNIARAFYDDGEYEKSGELFAGFAMQNPSYKDAAVAGNLSLDSYRQLNDFKKIDEVGKKFLASALPASFKSQVSGILQKSAGEAIGEIALTSIEESGEVIEGLLKKADESKGTELGEKALYGAFVAVREKKDFAKQKELAQRFMGEYPKSQFLSDVLLSTARQSAESGYFQDAAGYFEQIGQKMGNESAGLDGWLAAAKLQLALGKTQEGIHDLDTAADLANGPRKVEIYDLIADAWMKQKNFPRAKAAADTALKLDRLDSKAGSVLAEIQATTAPNADPKPLVATLTAIAQGPNGQNEDTARALWYLGEMLYGRYKAMPGDQVEQKVASLQELEGVYTQAASMGSPEFAVASLWRLGLAYANLADVVESSPPPAGMTAEDWHKNVKEQTEPVKQRSEGAFKACIARAQSLEVFSTAVIGCRQKSENVKPPLVPVSPGATPSTIVDLQKKAEGSIDPAPFEALGMAYLQAHQVPLAQLALGRATELQDTRASAHNALGVSFLLAGDAMSARSEYGKALDADPTYEKARANLAGLRCRFGDAEGAKRELSLIKDTSGLSGPDVDPDWRSCK